MSTAGIPGLKELQKIVGYKFRDAELLKQALVHRSRVNEARISPREKDNERLEFLGDAVLQLAISDYLIREFPSLDEGELTKKRSALVRAESLAVAAENLKLGRHLVLGRGEEASGGRGKASILAGALEAVLGAIYLDGGYDAAAGIIESWLRKFLRAVNGVEFFQSDYKSRLQEVCQSRYHQSPEYVIIDQSGPDHHKTFQVGVRLQKELRGFGKGRSKKEAEQAAARDVLLSLEAGPAPEVF
jgi:ribonuclease-3